MSEALFTAVDFVMECAHALVVFVGVAAIAETVRTALHGWATRRRERHNATRHFHKL